MNNKFNSASTNSFSLTPAIIFGLLLTFGLQGCLHDDDDDPVVVPDPSANATGYYEGTASILEEDNSTALEISDLKAFVNGDQVLIMSASNVLLYELQGISITHNDYTATVNIYKDGTFLATTTVSGVITEAASLTGTFAGSGAGNGSFDVAYSSVNDTDADLATIATSWQGDLNNISFKYEILTSGTMSTIFPSFNGVLGACDFTAIFTPISNENLYSITSMVLTDCTDSNVNGTNYTGLATTTTSGNRSSDDTMPIAFSNGSFSGTGEIPLD